MPNNLLIDHTGLHAFVRRQHPVSEAESVLREREFLQLTEHLLLADGVFLSDTESAPVMDLAWQINERLLDGGVATSSGEGVFRVAHVSQAQHRQICKRAARAAYTELSQREGKWLRDLLGTHGYAVRPTRVRPVDLNQVLKMNFGSDQADAYVTDAMGRKDVTATLSLPLLDEDLYLWLKEHIAPNEPADSPLNARLAVLLRWKTNEQIAAHIGANDMVTLPYSPALGRGLLIEEFEGVGWPERLKLIETSIAKHRKEQGMNERLMELQRLGPVPAVRIPAFAIWFVLRLPETCTFNLFVEELVAARNSPDVVFMRKHLQELPAEELQELCERVARETRVPAAALGPNGKITAASYIKLTALKLPGVEIGSEVRLSSERTERDLWREPLTIRRLWRRLWKGREATILTGYMEDMLAFPSVHEAVKRRVLSILASAPSE